MNNTEPPETGPAERRRVARALIGRATADPDLSGLTADLQRLCRAATEALGLRGAAVHLMTSAGSEGVAASSDSEALAVAELEFASGEGPARVAFLTQRPVLVPALDGALNRWPGFSTTASERGVRAVFAFPLQEGAVCLGVLELHAGRPGSLDPGALAVAGEFARAATGVVLDGGSVTAAGDLDPGLVVSLRDRARIHQAQGMVMVDLRITLTEALTRMRARAFASGTTLLDVADAVIAGTLTADVWIDGDGSPDGHPR